MTSNRQSPLKVYPCKSLASNTTGGYSHTPVLLNEVVQGLDIRADGNYVDATFGRGGHSMAILKKLDANGRLYVFDKDPAAIDVARQMACKDGRCHFYHASFRQLAHILDQAGCTGLVDGILFDLGVSSPQLDDPARGFSFLRDGDLDMRMNTETGQRASDWVNTAPREEIVDVLRQLGEERYAGRIATNIVNERDKEPFMRTERLATVISTSIPRWEKDKHPATRSFQAIRMYINSELEELQLALEDIISLLRPGGRLLVISFHSLEDRLVKRFMRDAARGDDYPADLPVTVDQLNPRLKLVGKAIRPGSDEVAANPRARSAILRIAEKLAA